MPRCTHKTPQHIYRLLCEVQLLRDLLLIGGRAVAMSRRLQLESSLPISSPNAVEYVSDICRDRGGRGGYDTHRPGVSLAVTPRISLACEIGERSDGKMTGAETGSACGG